MSRHHRALIHSGGNDIAVHKLRPVSRANRLPDQIYDVTAWSMPSLWDVELIMADRATGAATLSLNNTRQMHDVASLRDAAVGYLMPWGTDAAAAVARWGAVYQ